MTALSGKTIEVLNTDAEGRLILADAMVYAARIGCTHLVDAATLTGAVVVALGTVNIGAFSNNDEFLEKVLSSARSEGEKMWALPMDEEYKEQLSLPTPIWRISAGAPADRSQPRGFSGSSVATCLGCI